MGDLDDLLKQVTSGNAPDDDVHAAYDQVATGAPRDALADGLSHAFNSDRTPPFAQMLAGLFGQSNPEQKAGLLNQILGSLGQSGGAEALGTGGVLGGSQGSVTPQQAQQVPSEEVQELARKAAETNPSIVDAAASFYAQHPTLIKTIGAGALALLMSKLSAARQ